MANVGRPKNPPSIRDMLKDVLPIEEIFDEDEVKIYHKLVDVYMADFDKDELTSSDMDNIMDLAKNRILEFRLLQTAKTDKSAVLDISAALEKIRKDNNKLQESLSTRRKDRGDINKHKGISIVTLAVAFDEERKSEIDEKLKRLDKEEEDVLEKRKKYTGNRYDHDSKTKERND